MTKKKRAPLKQLAAMTPVALSGLIDSAEELLESLELQHGERAEQLRSRLYSIMGSASDRLEQIKEDSSEYRERAARAAAGFVRRGTWKTVAILAGVTVGLVLLTRTHDE